MMTAECSVFGCLGVWGQKLMRPCLLPALLKNAHHHGCSLRQVDPSRPAEHPYPSVRPQLGAFFWAWAWACRRPTLVDSPTRELAAIKTIKDESRFFLKKNHSTQVERQDKPCLPCMPRHTFSSPPPVLSCSSPPSAGLINRGTPLIWPRAEFLFPPRILDT